MAPPRRVAPLAIDLAGELRRSVTSLYSNLVTRPTGRAIRLGVESQIGELRPQTGAVCLSTLDFAQVRVLDYSCADEVVAKLLLRFLATDRPAEAYFMVCGMGEHHREAVESVLERHGLLLVVEEPPCSFQLLGPCDPFERACWQALLGLGRVPAALVAEQVGVSESAADAALASLAARRVAIALPDATHCALPTLADC